MKWLVLIGMMWFSVSAFSSISARVDRTEVTVGESLTLEIIVSESNAAAPDLSALEPAFQVAHTGQTSSVQIVNGNMKKESTWQIILFPQSEGLQVIPPIEIAGEKTQPINIRVNKPDPASQNDADFFIELTPEKTTAYVQEAIGLTVKLFYRVTPRNAGLTDPSGAGLIVQSVKNSVQYTVQRNNTTYNVLERRYVMYSENSGQVTMNPVVFSGEVADGRRQSFSMFQRGRPVRFMSEMVEFDIKPIPQSFIGQPWVPAELVQLEDDWSQTGEYRVGEPITRTIELTIKGMTENQLPELEPKEISGARVYTDTADTQTQTDGEHVIAKKTVRFAVIPAESGQLKIPEYKLTWFDTINQKTRVATIAAQTLDILPSVNMPANQQQTQTPITAPNTDVVNLDSGLSNNALNTSSVQSGTNNIWLWATMGFAFAWLLTLYLWWNSQKRSMTIASHQAEDKTHDRHLDKQDIKGLLNSSNPADQQQGIINWWNHSHRQKVTNLSQIAQQIDDQQTLAALSGLQTQLYGNAPVDAVEASNWQSLIKSGGFNSSQKPLNTHQGLPPLYQ